MIKIYNAIGTNGKVVLKKGINFSYGVFDTGYDGYGKIVSGRDNCKRADYLIEKLEHFRNYIKEVEKIDGFIRNDNFVFYNPYSAKELDFKQKKFNEADLKEEGILLFTDYVSVDYKRNNNIQRIFGRFPETGAYIILPGSTLEMSFPAYEKKSKNKYEVLESASRPKQLYLIKVDREIYPES